MKKYLFILLAVVMGVSCKQVQQPQTQVSCDALQEVKTIPLSEYSILHLYRSSDSDNYVAISLNNDDGQVDEFMGVGNAEFCTTSSGDLTIDTVEFTPNNPSYIIRTYDKTSTFGAETWFVLSPYYDNNSDGFWALYRLPFQMARLSDVDSDGVCEIINYLDPQHTDSAVYSFDKGILALK